MSLSKSERITTKERIRIASRESRIVSIVFIVVLAVLFALSTGFTKFNPFEAILAQGEFWSFIGNDFIPPTMGKWNALLDSILQTLYMALASSGLSTVLAVFFAFLGTPAVCRIKAVNTGVRAVMSIIRNIPGLVWVFILVAAFGIGTEVGIISLVLGTTGGLTRYFIETLDEVADENIEALRSTGAGTLPMITQAILPAAAPGFIAWFLYTIELNIRASSIIGMVGAGGIGMLMMAYIKQYNYSAASTVILAVAVIIIAVNLLTDYLSKIALK